MATAHFIGGSRANEVVEFENKVDFPTVGYSIKSCTVELPHTGLHLDNSYIDNDNVFFVCDKISDADKIQEMTKIQEMKKIHWKLFESSNA